MYATTICKEYLQGIIAKQLYKTYLQEILARNVCKACFQEIFAKHNLPKKYLQEIFVSEAGDVSAHKGKSAKEEKNGDIWKLPDVPQEN